MSCTQNFYTLYLQVITVLNHAGLCTSYTTAWKYLKQLTQESRYLEIIRDGYWLWIYDNLNLHQKVRHERQGTKHHRNTLSLVTQFTCTHVTEHVRHILVIKHMTA